MIIEATEKVSRHIDLSEYVTRKVFEEIMSGLAPTVRIKSFITALRDKGETVEEIAGAAKIMREKALKIDAGGGAVVDTCGTGGSGLATFNISTAAAFVVAGCGVKVAKHGNRGASSPCGSADVLEALGVNINAGAGITQRCIREIGIGFLFAPLFHSAMKHAAQVRKEIGTRTIFNLLGPLSNPASARNQVVGVYNADLTVTIARVLKKLGARRAFVVHGMDGLDEITITGRTKVSELRGGRVKTCYVTPETFGLNTAKISDIKGGTAAENARILLSVLKGSPGPARDVVLLNAAAALTAAGRAKNFKEGIRLAAESIDSGSAMDKLKRLIKMTGKR